MVVVPALTSRRHELQHTHALAHMAFLLLVITHTWTHTRACLYTEVLLVCFYVSTPTSPGSMTKSQKSEKQTKRGERGGSPRLSGMTKIKAFKRIKRKKIIISGTQQLCSPKLCFHMGEMGMNLSQKEEVQKAKKLRRGRGFDTLQ